MTSSIRDGPPPALAQPGLDMDFSEAAATQSDPLLGATELRSPQGGKGEATLPPAGAQRRGEALVPEDRASQRKTMRSDLGCRP